MVNRRKSVSASDFYRRLFPYIKPHWRLFSLAVFGMVLYSAAEAGFAISIKPLVDEGLAVRGSDQFSLWLPLIIFAVLLARGLGNFISVYFLTSVGELLMRSLRSELFHHLVHMPISSFAEHSRGSIVGKMSYNVSAVSYSTTKVVTALVKDSLTVMALSVWLFYINWQLSLGFLLVTPLIGISVWLAARRFRQVSKRIQKMVGVVAEQVQQTIQANHEIKVFNAQEHEQQSFEKNNDYAYQQGMKFALAKALAGPVAMLFAGVGLVLVIYWVISGTVGMEASPGLLASFLVTLLLLFRPLRNLIRLNSIIQPSVAAGAALFEFMDEPVERIKIKRPSAKSRRLQGGLCFKQVSLRYPGASQWALRDIQLDIAAHETVAVIGRSGSGKTSLVKLIPRFYEPDHGQVLIDGRDIKTMDLYELREQISYVGQTANLLNDTVMNNVAYGCEASREQVVEAAELAEARTFIEKLPQGFDTQLSNDGSGLSAGERQRIAIARAFIKSAPILIMDEATSALDSASESAIQKAMENIRKGRTSLLAAHRMSTVRHVPRIVVMSAGRIVEQGDHDGLMKQSGVYSELYRHYSGQII